jgi:hypothetical protein
MHNFTPPCTPPFTLDYIDDGADDPWCVTLPDGCDRIASFRTKEKAERFIDKHDPPLDRILRLLPKLKPAERRRLGREIEQMTDRARHQH